MDKSIERVEQREAKALELASKSYDSNDLEVADWDDFVSSRCNPPLESCDGGYWVAARVWVDFESVEDALGFSS